MRMCINKRVVIGLAAVAVGILVVAPQAFVAALPLLIVLVCPLSMMLMMRGMSGGQTCGAGNSEATSAKGRPANVSLPEDDAELIRLRGEVDQLRVGIRDRDGDPTVPIARDDRR